MFFQPRCVREGSAYLEALQRLIHYKEDILRSNDLATLRSLVDKMKEALKSRQRECIIEVQAAIDKECGRIAPPPKHAGLRENIEGFLVPIIMIVAVKAYFLQPFKIPTGSMQPTLYGFVAESISTPPPNLLMRGFELVLLGQNYIDVVTQEDDTIVSLEEKTYLNFFTFTKIVGRRSSYTVFAPAATLGSIGVQPSRSYRKGDVIARARVGTGDMVFVDKLSYNFVFPREGDVFVFKTTGITGIHTDVTQHYIKRLAGVPGDTLRIDQPNLFLNGQLARQGVFQRVMSEKDGYRGYANLPTPFLSEPGDTVTVPTRSYFALGDNSFNSLDSRFWGVVPEQNVAGRGLFVLWPFSKRWGLIH